MKPKFFNLTFLICMMYANAFTQITITAQKTIGGSGGDFFVSLAATNDGGLISGGTSYSDMSFEKSENGRGNGDYWVVKMDKDRNIQWDKTIGGSGFDEFKSVIQTSDGGYAFIGSSNSNISFEKSESSRGSSDYWLVKLDAMGNIQWDKTIGSSGDDYVEELIQTKDGGFILAGSSNSNISGEKSANGRGGMDVWIVKLNKLGEKVWDKTFGGNNDDWCSSFAGTADGGVIIGGSSLSNISGEKTENTRGGFDYWVLKLDSKGTLQWDKTIGGDAHEFCQNIFQTADRGYIIAGSSLSGISGEKTEYSRGGADYWAVKLDKNGNIQWDKTIGGSGDDWCNAMIQTKSHGYMLIGGSLSSASGDKSEYDRGGSDYWLVNLDRKGKLLGEKTVGGYYDDWGSAVAEPEKNTFWIGGHSYSPIGADKTEFARDNGDYWIVKLEYDKHASLTDSVSENVYSQLMQKKLSDAAFTVYPNPAKNILNIHTYSKALISLTDLSGKIILTKTIEGSDLIDVSKLSAGIYILKNNTTGETKKIMVSN